MRCVFLSRSEICLTLCPYNVYNCIQAVSPDYAIMPPVADYILVTNKPFIYRLLFSALRCPIYTHLLEMYTENRAPSTEHQAPKHFRGIIKVR